MSNQKSIRLYKDINHHSIMAVFTVDGLPDMEIKSVMGTHIIPTAYTDKANLVETGAEIGKLNPGYAVEYSL